MNKKKDIPESFNVEFSLNELGLVRGILNAMSKEEVMPLFVRNILKGIVGKTTTELSTFLHPEQIAQFDEFSFENNDKMVELIEQNTYTTEEDFYKKANEEFNIEDFVKEVKDAKLN